eukprot:11901783-Alexandrium_andersonii.AAC.1
MPEAIMHFRVAEQPTTIQLHRQVRRRHWVFGPRWAGVGGPQACGALSCLLGLYQACIVAPLVSLFRLC